MPPKTVNRLLRSVSILCIAATSGAVMASPLTSSRSIMSQAVEKHLVYPAFGSVPPILMIQADDDDTDDFDTDMDDVDVEDDLDIGAGLDDDIDDMGDLEDDLDIGEDLDDDIDDMDDVEDDLDIDEDLDDDIDDDDDLDDEESEEAEDDDEDSEDVESGETEQSANTTSSSRSRSGSKAGTLNPVSVEERESLRTSNQRESGIDENGYPIDEDEIILIEKTANDVEKVRELGYSVKNRQSITQLGISITTLRVPQTSDIVDAIQEIRGNYPDLLVDYNHVYELSNAFSAYQNTIKLAVASNGTLSDLPSLSIGMIDTRADRMHPSLSDARIRSREFLESGAKTPTDHGTAVASILVGSDNNGYRGLLPRAELHAASVFDLDGNGKPRTKADRLARAVDWMMDRQVPVISFSLAGPPNLLLQHAIEKADQKGHIVVAAVGNAGPAAPILYPAGYDSVLGITAVDQTNRIYRRSGRGDHVDFAAPGVQIRAAADAGGYRNYSGTSFAVPYASAIAATVLRSPSAASKSNAISSLKNHAKDLGAEGYDPIHGFGLIKIPE